MGCPNPVKLHKEIKGGLIGFLVSSSLSNGRAFLFVYSHTQYIQMTKNTYLDAHEKHKVRQFLLSKFKFEQVVGLPGPDFNAYVESLSHYGAKQFDLYEYSPSVLVRQLAMAKHPVNMHIGDILQADNNRSKTLFDLDFCVTATSCKEHISKFTNNFIMTFSRRDRYDNPINVFVRAKNQTIKQIITLFEPLKHSIIETKEGDSYIYVEYHDTSSMCCIAKIN